MVIFVNVCVFHQVWLLSVLEAVKVSPLIEKVSDHKDFKKLLRTRTNVLVLYTETGQRRQNPVVIGIPYMDADFSTNTHTTNSLI